MKLYYTKFLIVLLIAFFISRTTSIYAQVKIGNHPTTINKASLLELESDSLGLLLPRLKDTITINSLNPPDGMVIYNIDALSRQHFYIRRYGAWSEMGNSNEFLLKTGLKSDSVVTTLNGELRKLSFDSVVANSINNNSTLITNVINNASSFNLSNGLRTDSIVTTVNGSLHKVSVDSLINSSIKFVSGYLEPIQVIQGDSGVSVFSDPISFPGGAASFVNNEMKKFIFYVPGAKQGDIVNTSTIYGFNDALFVAKSVVKGIDAVEVTIINSSPLAVSSTVQMSIALIRK